MLPELVAPGGSYTKAMVAGHYGADAIYLGVPYTSLRMRQNKIKDFAILKNTIDDLHTMNKKAFLTMNIFPRNTDIKIFERITEQVSDLNADGIIFGDPGTYQILKKYMPNQHYHLSTQTNTLNYEAVKFRRDQGVRRVILARELHIDEIKAIKKEVPDIELEVFIHGAMCIAYSGRCLLGEYFSGRDGNKGECSHVCRYNFSLGQPTKEGGFSCTEAKRGSKQFDILQNSQGTNIFSSKDLCTIEKIDQLLQYVDAVKIEGRSKGERYVGAVCKAYRHIMNAYNTKKSPDPMVKNLVYQIPHRPYREGFLFQDRKNNYPDGEPTPPPSAQCTANDTFADRTLTSAGPEVNKEYFGLVLPETIEIDGQTAHRLIPKQTIEVSDSFFYITPTKQEKIKIKSIFDHQGNSIERIHCNTTRAYILTDKTLCGWELLYNDPVNY